MMNWEPMPDTCQLHPCDNPYIEGTGDDDEGHWVCGLEDCAGRLASHKRWLAAGYESVLGQGVGGQYRRPQ